MEEEDETEKAKLKEIYTYDCAWDASALSWSCRRDKPFRLAVGSFILEYANKVEVVQLDEERNELVKRGSFDHPYPATKIMWNPDHSPSSKDLIATTGDYLRLWDVNSSDDNLQCPISMKVCLNNNKKTDFCAPLTSFDWNADDCRIIGTASIDTTCSIWDIETQQATTQLIAHDKEVYDIAFAKGADIFASVGADGSVRLFDLRSLEHSTIVYESRDAQPIIRLSWNKCDPNYLATVMLDQPAFIILDVRVPSIPVATLSNHAGSVNSVQWPPHSSCHICSAAEDSQALIWDLSCLPDAVDDPILAYTAEAEINGLQWSALQTDWISIVFSHKMQILRV